MVLKEQICKQGVQAQGVQAMFLFPDRWSFKGLSRFISNSSQTSFRQTFVDFFM